MFNRVRKQTCAFGNRFMHRTITMRRRGYNW